MITDKRIEEMAKIAKDPYPKIGKLQIALNDAIAEIIEQRSTIRTLLGKIERYKLASMPDNYGKKG